MFVLHTSNRTENLLSHLAQVIDTQPLDSPFEQELFLIQSQGMERWLSQQLASQFGVWGNYRFLFPGHFVSEISAPFIDTRAANSYQREQMVWIIEDLLREIEQEQNPLFQVVSNYLNGAGRGVRRFQLAQQLARIFDQYQMMRPDWLRAWSNGTILGLMADTLTEQWQSELWRRINHKVGDCHRGEIWQRAIDEIERSSESTLQAKLPKRISIFGLNTAPPLLLNLLKALSRRIDIHLYLLTPTQEYWGEGGSRKALLEQMNQSMSADGSALNDHRLLLSLGEQAREFQKLMLEQVEFSHEFASYENSGAKEPSLLHLLQNDLLANRSRVATVAKDESITIHSCHSRLREVEVLHDQLLDLLQKDDSLELRDIVVMSPDIQNYAAHIKTIFTDLSYSIADRTLRDESQILDNTVQILKVARGRFGWQEVLDLLEKPLIYPAFGLVEKDLQLIRHWIGEVNIRWGLSAAHRAEQGLPEFDAFSWQAGLDRLMMGYATGECDEIVDGILPFADVEGNSAQALGGLYRFIAIMADAHLEFKRPTSLSRWAQRIRRYTSQLFDHTGVDESTFMTLNTLIEELADDLGQLHQGEVEIEVIEQWMNGSLSERKSANGFLRGQLTFCSMLPMRTIPFKVIALIGMNEGEYPRIVHPYTFDLMGSDHRTGDRSIRNDDRAQFLETVLSARERLLISYVGQSIQDNSEISPSAVVSEVIDLLELNYQQSGVVTRHPLQPFNHTYFEPASPLFSYSERDLNTARVLMAPKLPSQPWWQGEIEQQSDQVIELYSLFHFFREPQSYFLEKGLGIRLQERAPENDERERFDIDPLENYSVNQMLVEQMLQATTESTTELNSRQMIDSGQLNGWWIGTTGEIELEKRMQAAAPFVDTIQSLELGARQDAVDIDIEVGRYRLVGQLAHHHEGGALLYRFGKMKGSDLIKGWLYHLIANRVGPLTTTVVTQDRTLQFLPEMNDTGSLQRWLALYDAGQSQPSELFVEPAYAYLKQLSINSRKSPLDAARSRLHEQLSQDYNSGLRTLYQGVDDVDALISERFEALCHDLLVPIWSELT